MLHEKGSSWFDVERFDKKSGNVDLKFKNDCVKFNNRDKDLPVATSSSAISLASLSY